MKFSTDNPFVKFYLDQKNHETGWVELRVCTIQKSKEIRKKTNKTIIEYKRHQRYEVEDVNEGLEESLRWDYCIGGWSGVLRENGEPWENTTENKVILMNECNPFATFVADNLEKLSDDEASIREAAEKNS